MWKRKDLRLDLIGLRVGQLVVIKYHGCSDNGHTLWIAKCDCGNEKIVLGKDFKRGKNGKKCNNCHLKEKKNKLKNMGIVVQNFIEFGDL